MPQLQQYTSGNQTAVNVPTTTETVIATCVVPSIPGAGVNVNLTGVVHLTTGGSTTAVTVRVRRGGLTGTVIGTGPADTIIGAAGSTDPYTMLVTDNPPDSANLTYVLTVQQAGAVAAGTGVLGTLTASVG